MKWALAGLVLAAAATPALAQQPSERDRRRATELLRQGAALLDDKEPAQALERFNQAFELVGSPKIQFNIGLALTALDRRAAALRAFQRYLREANDDRAARREEAAGRATALRARVALVHLRVDLAGAAISVDGVEQGKAPLDEPLVVDPGPHGIVVQAPTGDRSWTRAIRADAGGTLELVATLSPPSDARGAVPIPPPAPAPAPATAAGSAAVLVEAGPPADAAPPRPLHRRPWFWVAMGAAVAAAATGVVIGVSRGERTEFSCPIASCIHGK